MRYETGTYENSPEVDDDKESEIELLMKREYENEEVVGDGLSIAVEGVECVRGEWCGDYKSRKVNLCTAGPRSGWEYDLLIHLWWGLCNHL